MDELVKQAHVHLTAKEYSAAEDCLSRAVDLCGPDDINTLVGIEGYYTETDNAQMRLKIVDKLLDAGGNSKYLLKHKIVHLSKLKRYEEALVLGEFYLQSYGGDPDVYTAMVCINKDYGNAADVVYYAEKWLELSAGLSYEEQMPYYANIMMYAAYERIFDAEAYKALIARIRTLTEPLEKLKEFGIPTDYFKRLKIGYLSADFRYHPIGVFMYPIVVGTPGHEHDIFYYSIFNPRSNTYKSVYSVDITEECKKHGTWKTLHHMDGERLERFLLREKPDIVFDLAAHTNGSRLWLFAKRIAPVQITYLGFPTTTGVAAMDYNIVDVNTDPDGAEEFYTEKLLRMSKTSLCHVLIPEREPAEPPFIKNGYITFGCFANDSKHTSTSHRLMAGVLNKVKDSRILLTLKGYEGEELAESIRRKLTESGLPMERVQIEPTRNEQGYLDCYDQVDIVLDTFPFNGATTTCDALNMGVPVVTLAGDTQAARRGLSILRNVGLEELVAFTEDEYIEIASELARAPHRLKHYRANLRQQKSESDLADAAAFVDEFTFQVRKTWIEYCRAHKTLETSYENKTDSELEDELRNAERFIEYDQSDDVMIEYHRLKTEHNRRARCR